MPGDATIEIDCRVLPGMTEPDIRSIVEETGAKIDIEDTGDGFDPNSVNQEELEQLISKRKTGGLGMRLMKSLMDEVRYEIEPGKKNALHLMKRLKKPTDEK